MRFHGRRSVGAVVQHRNGYIHVKVEDQDGKERWIAQGRCIWELQRGDLEEGDRVYHINGDRTDNRIQNLAKVHFNSTKFVFLKESRVLFDPDKKIKKEPTSHEPHSRIYVNSNRVTGRI